MSDLTIVTAAKAGSSWLPMPVLLRIMMPKANAWYVPAALGRMQRQVRVKYAKQVASLQITVYWQKITRPRRRVLSAPHANGPRKEQRHALRVEQESI